MEQLVRFNQGDLILNWAILPEPFRSNIELRDKVLNELKNQYGDDAKIDSRVLYDMNRYVIKRINSKIEKK